MGDLGGLLSTALAVISIATIAGLALQRGVVTNLREQLKDEREARAADEKEAAKAEAKHLKFKAEAETENAELKADNAALRRVVTGEVHWVALGDRLEDAIQLLTAVKDALARLLKDGGES